MKRLTVYFIPIVFLGFAFTSCNQNSHMGYNEVSAQGMMGGGTGWGHDVFNSNGERIYFTSTSDRGTAITYTSGPSSNNWMMMGGRMACVSCHGVTGRGGRHFMGMMQEMKSKDIRWSALAPEFNAEKFRLAVVNGQDPDGSKLKPEMPRWNISNEDLADIISFLKTLR